jgi:hypothetical protein
MYALNHIRGPKITMWNTPERFCSNSAPRHEDGNDFTQNGS